MKEVYKKNDLQEYRRILKFLIGVFGKDDLFSLLDVGSGLCEFPLFLSKNMKNVKITCVDINEELVKLADSYGFRSIKADVCRLPFIEGEFDVVHCSHVIEHLSYPRVINAIEEMLKIIKPGGYLIIRSPLWQNHRFFYDIDHVRPYPPQSIMNYFDNPQQKRKGKISVQKIKLWYVKPFYEFDENLYPYKFIRLLNVFFKLIWLFIGWPADKNSSYGLILKKTSEKDKEYKQV